ncbi:hypothetical protein [Aquimarina aquimarini]|uniref:hypothetical protein n=1 Tax=Aquimarina aquimarini TaxID=1191734 RepID=UPI000D56068E|nr:hypothetical protein [Aquimarina aquimarini]
MKEQSLPITNVSHLIPQKKPFEMVSALLAFSETSITSSLTITAQNILVTNHQLTEPGLVENMAQTVALHTGYDYFLKGSPAPIGYIGSIKKVIISSLPKVEETITTRAEILHEFMGVTLVQVDIYNPNKEVIASGQMKTVIANQ